MEGGARNPPFTFLKVNYTVFANKTMTADNRTNTRNREIL
jgi:hypothetical protein